jgi:hypothetical protein
MPTDRNFKGRPRDSKFSPRSRSEIREESGHSKIFDSAHIRPLRKDVFISLSPTSSTSEGHRRFQGKRLFYAKSFHGLMREKGPKSWRTTEGDKLKSPLLNTNAVHERRSLDMLDFYYAASSVAKRSNKYNETIQTKTNHEGSFTSSNLLRADSPLKVLSPSFAMHGRKSSSINNDMMKSGTPSSRPPRTPSRSLKKSTSFSFFSF